MSASPARYTSGRRRPLLRKRPRPGLHLEEAFLEFETCPTTSVAAQRPVARDDAVAGDEERKAVSRHGLSCGARRVRSSRGGCKPTVGPGLACGNRPAGLPGGPMERRGVVNVDGHVAEVLVFTFQESLDLVAKIDEFVRGPLGVVDCARRAFLGRIRWWVRAGSFGGLPVRTLRHPPILDGSRRCRRSTPSYAVSAYGENSLQGPRKEAASDLLPVVVKACDRVVGDL